MERWAGVDAARAGASARRVGAGAALESRVPADEEDDTTRALLTTESASAVIGLYAWYAGAPREDADAAIEMAMAGLEVSTEALAPTRYDDGGRFIDERFGFAVGALDGRAVDETPAAIRGTTSTVTLGPPTHELTVIATAADTPSVARQVVHLTTRRLLDQSRAPAVGLAAIEVPETRAGSLGGRPCDVQRRMGLTQEVAIYSLTRDRVAYIVHIRRLVGATRDTQELLGRFTFLD